MKEKIEPTIEYQRKSHLYGRYFADNTPTEDIMKVFEVSFPQEYKLWSRELVGGNDGIHKIIKDERSCL